MLYPANACGIVQHPAAPFAEAERRVAVLGRAGFFVHHSSGSHRILKHHEKTGLRVTLPWHNKDLKRRTLLSIIEQSGFSPDEFMKLF